MLIRHYLQRLLHDKRGATAVMVAVMLPTLLIGVAFAVETAFVKVRGSQLQAMADSAAGGAREKLDPYQPSYPKSGDKKEEDGVEGGGGQQAPIDEALRLAGKNDLPNSITPGDIEQGWWDITSKKDDKFGPPIAGQTGLPFSNAIRVTAREDHQFAMGALLGMTHRPLSATSTGYKCSNLDYPLTRIADDPFPPAVPAIYMSWETPGHDDKTSYYYDNPTDGNRNPVIKLWSPTDGEDVSFVLFNSDGSLLQVDTYCRGTFLVIPAAFNWKNLAGPITAKIYRGSTNNSFTLYPNQSDHPVAFPETTFYIDPAHNIPIDVKYLNPDKVKTTPYPSSLGTQYWASEGNPTPNRRTTLVR